jgi:hypothetical protein
LVAPLNSAFSQKKKSQKNLILKILKIKLKKKSPKKFQKSLRVFTEKKSKNFLFKKLNLKKNIPPKNSKNQKTFMNSYACNRGSACEKNWGQGPLVWEQ